MLRKLGLLLIPLAILAAACSSDDNGDSDSTPAPSATSAADATGAPPGAEAGEPTAIVIATPDLGGGPIDLGGDESDPGGSIISAINPLSFLSAMDSGSATDGASPALAARLLTSADLPSGYLSMGEFGMSFPTTAGSSMEMAMTMFASGDIANTGELGSMVISAVIVVPPDARSEMDLDELKNMSNEDLEALMSASSLMGMGITDAHVLDASGLGEGGAGIHMEMDLAEAGAMFGAPPETDMPAGFAIDMFMFFEGDYLQMVMVMHATDAAADVDARSLADVLDSRGDGSA